MMTDDQLERLAATVQRLADIEEIRALRNRYHHFVNEGQFSRFEELFVADAVMHFDAGYSWRGIEEILKGLEGLSKAIPFMKQFIHSHHVTVDGDAAEGFAYLEAKYAQDGKSVMVAGRYDEKYTRIADGWRIKELEVELFFSVPQEQGWAGDRVQHFNMQEAVRAGNSS
jgi:ketosteroid isomerase-like protein